MILDITTHAHCVNGDYDFLKMRRKIKKLGYNDHFRRAWIYYLCYCEAGFEEGYTGDIHLLLAKPECMLGRGFTG